MLIRKGGLLEGGGVMLSTTVDLFYQADLSPPWHIAQERYSAQHSIVENHS